jgi:hypothetical protein
MVVDMCHQCDGITLGSLLQSQELLIRTHGFTMTQVSDGKGGGYTYTVGLQERFEHPDLIVFDVKLALQAEVLKELATSVVERGVLPSSSALHRNGLSAVRVHTNHLNDGLVAMWSQRHHRVPLPGEFLQVVFSSAYFCSCHATAQRLLDKPLARRSGGSVHRGKSRQRRR